MERVYNFFENLSEIVYVSDMDSYDILYMNQKALDVYGISSVEEVKGRKCYEVLQGGRAPCAICTNRYLKAGEFVEWRYYNPVLGATMELKDTMLIENGRKYRFEMAVNISDREQQKNMIEVYRHLETLANEGFRLALKADNADMSLDIILEYLGKALKGERTYIFEKNAKGNDDNTYEWVAEGVTAEKENLIDLPAAVCAKWYRQFGENKIIVIKDLEDIREIDPLQYQNLKRQNIHSLVVVPLYDKKKVIGFYGVDNPPMDYLEYSRDMLQIVAHFIVFALKQRNLVNKLVDIGLKDRLTGFGNRYALDNFVRERKFEHGLGVVFCDITGLKRVNDREGHQAGDRYIVRACDALKSVFGNYALFRIGGDEILAMCDGISESEMLSLTEQLKIKSEENGTALAVGTDWQSGGEDIDLDRLLKASEQAMYADKAEYYARTGIDRRV